MPDLIAHKDDLISDKLSEGLYSFQLPLQVFECSCLAQIIPNLLTGKHFVESKVGNTYVESLESNSEAIYTPIDLAFVQI